MLLPLLSRSRGHRCLPLHAPSLLDWKQLPHGTTEMRLPSDTESRFSRVFMYSLRLVVPLSSVSLSVKWGKWSLAQGVVEIPSVSSAWINTSPCCLSMWTLVQISRTHPQSKTWWHFHSERGDGDRTPAAHGAASLVYTAVSKRLSWAIWKTRTNAQGCPPTSKHAFTYTNMHVCEHTYIPHTIGK